MREVVRRSGFHALLGDNKFHLAPHAAVVSVLERWDAEEDTDRIDQYFATTEPEKKEATPAAS